MDKFIRSKWTGEKKFKNLCKIYIALFVFAIVLMISIRFIIDYFNHNSSIISNINEPKICTKKSCIKAAHTILQNMDPSVDPCEDFNAFSCGSFIKTRRIPDDKTKIDEFDILNSNLAYEISDILSTEVDDNDIKATRNAKRLYHSCIDEDFLLRHGEERYLSMIRRELDGWPIIGIPSHSSSVIEKLLKFIKYGYKPLIAFTTTLNPKSPQHIMLKVRQPGWLFNKHYYNDTHFVEAYKEYMFKFLHNLNSSAPDLPKKIEKIFELEKLIAKNLIDEEKKRIPTFKTKTLGELIDEVPLFDWKAFIIEGVFKDVKNVTINETEPIIIDDLEYLKFAADLIWEYENTNRVDELHDLMVWSAMMNSATFLPKKYKEIKLEFDKVYRGTTSILSRQISCATYVMDNMEYAVGRLYVAKFFNYHSKAAADYIDTKVGYPEFIYNDTYLNELYEEYEMNQTEFLNNTLKIYKLETSSGFSELRTERDRKDWISGPAVVNAFYSSSANQICFPAGILQNPFYDADNPNYLNYGAIGSVIGHEITHGFDDRGRLYDKNGIYHADGSHSLWTNKTIHNYKEKAKCIVDQYSKYYVKQINLTLNGILTQGENIADNGGLKESYRAYQKWVKTNRIEEPLLPGLNYNQNQLFFINYAQVWCAKYRTQTLLSRIRNANHSPGEFRIIGPTSNSKHFAEAFNCKPGQQNNPIKKCSVW